MKLLIISGEQEPHVIHEDHIAKIQATDASLEIVLAMQSEEEKIAKEAAVADIIAGWPARMPNVEGAKATWIHSFSAGVDKILTQGIKESEVQVSNSSGIHATPIAEHIIAFMLLFTKKFYTTFQNQQQKTWKRADNLQEIYDKTVLIVGLGHIGREAARLTSCFGAHVIAINQGPGEKPDFVEELQDESHLDDMLPRADFIVLSLPHTEETHHLFNKEKFSKMKQTAVLINIGRGPVVSEQELVEALQKGVIGGAALDVTEEEPLPADSPLWEMSNVVITPHHSGISEKYMDRAIDRFCLNLQAFLKEERMPNLIDKRKGY